MDTRICTGSADEQVACVRAASSGFGTKKRKDSKQLRLTMMTYALHRALIGLIVII